MTEFQKILFPVDLSESSEKILPYVRMVAKKFDAKVHIWIKLSSVQLQNGWLKQRRCR